MISVFNSFYQISALKAILDRAKGKVSKRTLAAIEKNSHAVRLSCKCGSTDTLRKLHGFYICEHCAKKLSDKAQQVLAMSRRERRKLGFC